MGPVGDRVDVRGVLSFLGLTYAVTWALTLPMWVTGTGLTWEWAPLLLVVMMFVPALSAVVVTKWISPRPAPLRELGVTGAGGLRKWWGRALLGVLVVAPVGNDGLEGVLSADELLEGFLRETHPARFPAQVGKLDPHVHVFRGSDHQCTES